MITRILIKTAIIVNVFNWIGSYYPFPMFSGNTPYLITRWSPKHPTIPPFNIPYPGNKEEMAKFQKLQKDLFNVMNYNMRFQYLGNDDAEREGSAIVDEYLYDNDTDRMLDEFRFVAHLDSVQKKIIKDGEQISPSRASQEVLELRNKLKSKIKPA